MRINITSVLVDDQPKALRFVQAPADLGPVVTAVFDDTCGNLIQITAEKEAS